MHGKLIGAFPGKRFDSNPHYSEDGRGGWSLSQMNVDRCIKTYEDYYLIFCLAGLVTSADEKSRVERTRITAFMDGKEVGCSDLNWRPGNDMWMLVDENAIFEWPQVIEMQPKSDGLIEFSVDVKLTTNPEWLRLEGMAYARIKNVGTVPDEDAKFRRPWIYSLLQLLPKRIRRKL